MLEPPAELLKDCVVAPPPEKQAFMALEMNKRLEAVGLLYNFQTTSLGLCNNDKLALRNWVADTKARYDAKNQDTGSTQP